MIRNAIEFGSMMPGKLDRVVFGIILGVILVTGINALYFGTVCARARAAGVSVGFPELIALRLRRIPPGLIINNRIAAAKSGVNLTSGQLSAVFLAGGNVEMVVQALIAARGAGIPLEFDRAFAIDLVTKGTDKNLLEAVKMAANPKVIDCPATASGKSTIDGVAKDGVIIKTKARMTVRTSLDRFVGGATEEALATRVGDGITAEIGSADSHKEVVEHPDRISKAVLDKGLDRTTALELLSIDMKVVAVEG